ncbi:TPA: hypothetical protein CPT85_03055 [Candidatus Gastranaerophilales bacterium HUM_21]|jgi:hypothetical protein|nr:MAG TPA: hypothetical protein CPT85_03055 [Candidatus Gastranaerophilales bacterium HUM_21]
MANLDNNLNINNAGRAYTPNLKKGEDVKPQTKQEETPVEIINDGTQAADSYGRILVKQAGKVDNPEMVKSIKDAVDFYINNQHLVAAGVKAGDDAYELFHADEMPNAYEKACCGSCDAVYKKAGKN